MLSVKESLGVVSSYLESELTEGNIIGHPLLIPYQTSISTEVGKFPKNNQANGDCTDLSAPKGFSDNDAINPQLCSLSYGCQSNGTW